MSAGRLASLGPADDDLHIAPESIQEIHKALHGKTRQSIIRQGRDLRLIDPQARRCLGLRKVSLLQNLVDGHGQPLTLGGEIDKRRAHG